MGVLTPTGKCTVKAASRTKDTKAAQAPKQKGRCYRPFWFCAGQVVPDWPFAPSERRTGIQRQRLVEGLEDVLRMTIRGRVEVGQDGPELRLRASTEIVQRSGEERAAFLPLTAARIQPR